jgi:hypothetical protein
VNDERESKDIERSSFLFSEKVIFGLVTNRHWMRIAKWRRNISDVHSFGVALSQFILGCRAADWEGGAICLCLAILARHGDSFRQSLLAV